MKNITKQNFRYCLAESEGKGCLCAAMFHLKCGDNNDIILNFKADDTSYGIKTRDAWLVGYPGENEMEGFYHFHKITFQFLQEKFPNEKWHATYFDWDDETLSCKMYDIENRSFPDQKTEEFWLKQFEISKKMWDAGFINGNYPQGHYMTDGDHLVLAVSYFGAHRGRTFTDQEIAAFISCHKIHHDNKKKNWFIHNYVHRPEVMKELLTDDFWRLTCASQLGTNGLYFDNYLKSFLELMGPSSRQEINDYIQACVSGNTENFEKEFESFNKTPNDQSLISS